MPFLSLTQIRLIYITSCCTILYRAMSAFDGSLHVFNVLCSINFNANMKLNLTPTDHQKGPNGFRAVSRFAQLLRAIMPWKKPPIGANVTLKTLITLIALCGKRSTTNPCTSRLGYMESGAY